MKKLILLIISLSILTGCDDRNCIKSHKEESICYTYMFHYVGKVMISTPISIPCEKTICDEYEVD